MSTEDDQAAERLAEIERTLGVLRREIGPPTDEPQDSGDAAQDMAAREQHAATIETLEDERRRLRRRLGLD
ncbi:hypothetical protein [Spirillospora sp. NPDC047279]|uniref:hypothetical protein n=1 Tax=Spirillospora sp. NPDC047279 TaxID=3155478 RepID=UPI0033E0CC6A